MSYENMWYLYHKLSSLVKNAATTGNEVTINVIFSGKKKATIARNKRGAAETTKAKGMSADKGQWRL